MAVAAFALALAMAPARALSAAGASLSVVPGTVAGIRGTVATVWVQESGGAAIHPFVYAFDPASGRLSAPTPGQAGWLRVTSGGDRPVPGRGLPFDIAVLGPAEAPPRDAYLDVVFVAGAADAAGGSAARVGAGTVVAFRGTGPAPSGWTADLAGPRFVWLAGGTWRVRVQGAATGWIAPEVRAQLGGSTSAAVLAPVLPRGRGEAAVRFRTGLPGVERLAVRVESGGRSVLLTRWILILPGAAVLGALAGVFALGGFAAVLGAQRRSGASRDG